VRQSAARSSGMRKAVLRAVSTHTVRPGHVVHAATFNGAFWRGSASSLRHVVTVVKFDQQVASGGEETALNMQAVSRREKMFFRPVVCSVLIERLNHATRVVLPRGRVVRRMSKTRCVLQF